MGTLERLNIALRNQISRELYDYTKNYNGFLSMLAAIDNLYGVTSRHIRSNDVSGSEIQVEFRQSLPNVQGAMAVTGSLPSLELPAQSGFAAVAGTMGWSHYHAREDIRKAFVQHMDKDPKSVVPYVKSVSKALRDAVMEKLSSDIFPSNNLYPSRGTGGATNGNAQEDKIMSLAYPLQSGYVDNSLTPDSTVYPYLVDNLNATGYTGIKSVNAGTYGTPFNTSGNITTSALRRNILFPLRNRGAQVDLAIVDSAIYDYTIVQAEAKVVIEQMDKMVYGGTWSKYLNMFWMIEEKLDTLAATSNAKREAYFLDTSTWEFRQNGAFTETSVKDHPTAAWLLTMLMSFSCALICKHPRYNGRAFNVVP